MALHPSVIAQHRRSVRELSKPGQPLAPDSPNATINNPAWFARVDEGPSVPRGTRQELHARLIASVIDEHADVQAQHRAIILAGPPGAGKSTVLSEVLGDKRDQYLVIDADEFKRGLLKEALRDGSYEKIIVPDAIRERQDAGEMFYPLELASLVHEESSRLASALREDAIAMGTNIVIDTVLFSEDGAIAIGQQFEAAGYSIQVIDVEAPYEISEERIARRWQQSYEEAVESGSGLGGRWVPSEYVRGVYDGPDGRSKPEAAAERLATECGSVVRFRRFRTTQDATTGKRAERVTEVDKGRAAKSETLVDYDVAQTQRRAAQAELPQ